MIAIYLGRSFELITYSILSFKNLQRVSASGDDNVSVKNIVYSLLLGLEG